MASFKAKGYAKIQGGIALKTEEFKQIQQEIERFDGNYELDVVVTDGRHVSPQQRRLAFKLMDAIARSDTGGWYSDDIVSVKDYFYAMVEIFTDRKMSLSDATGVKSDANMLIGFLLKYVINQDVQLDFSPAELIDNDDLLYNYEYNCVMRGVCEVTGTPNAAIHHIDGIYGNGSNTIGFGSNRAKVSQIGRRIMSLSSNIHSEYHNIGSKKFFDKYHLKGVVVDEKIAKMMKQRGYGQTEEKV